MASAIHYALSGDRADMRQVQALSQQNHAEQLSPHERGDGFVTACWDVEGLIEAAGHTPHALAYEGEQVIGFALAVVPEVCLASQSLRSFWLPIAAAKYEDRPLSSWDCLMMGQVCVDQGYRGRGVFDGLYTELRRAYASRFDLVATGVFVDNPRSMAAHARVGFRPVQRCISDAGKSWDCIVWPWAAV